MHVQARSRKESDCPTGCSRRFCRDFFDYFGFALLLAVVLDALELPAAFFLCFVWRFLPALLALVLLALALDPPLEPVASRAPPPLAV
ncbi:MAG TPA: hypothetical protein VJR04_03535 [Terriglobales bacterium]|nr:hypothetical protein [Terriglobales bacterium]